MTTADVKYKITVVISRSKPVVDINDITEIVTEVLSDTVYDSDHDEYLGDVESVVVESIVG